MSVGRLGDLANALAYILVGIPVSAGIQV